MIPYGGLDNLMLNEIEEQTEGPHTAGGNNQTGGCKHKCLNKVSPNSGIGSTCCLSENPFTELSNSDNEWKLILVSKHVSTIVARSDLIQ